MNNEFDIQNFLEAQIEASVKADIEPAKIYAIAMTDGLMPSEYNYQNISDSDLEEWDAHYRRFKDVMNSVNNLMMKAKKNPDYTPENEQYIAGVFFASLISGIAPGTEITDHSQQQQSIYNKAIWIYDKIHQYEMDKHPAEIKKRMKLN